MYWESIPGMFTFPLLYKNMVSKFPSGSTFVEVGVWKGKSAVFMAEAIKSSRKKIDFFAVDLFDGSGGGYEDDLSVINGSLYEEYLKYIEPVSEIIKTIPKNSLEAYKEFEDESIDFLFLDGDHRYKGILSDLKNWYGKIKTGGVISGHDYNEPSCGVRQAVDEFFAFSAQSYMGGCWYKEK